MFGLKWLVDHDVLPKEKLEEYYASYVAGIFRTIRFGIGEAHGQAEMMEFNYFWSGAQSSGDHRESMPLTMPACPVCWLTWPRNFWTLKPPETANARETWFKKYDVMPAELQVSLKAASKVPVDVDPVFSFPEKIR